MLAAGFYRKEGRYTFHAIWGVIKIPGAQMTMANCSLLVIHVKDLLINPHVGVWSEGPGTSVDSFA